MSATAAPPAREETPAAPPPPDAVTQTLVRAASPRCARSAARTLLPRRARPRARVRRARRLGRAALDVDARAARAAPRVAGARGRRCVAIAALLGAGRLAGRRRQLAAAAALIPLTALMLMAGRVPDELVLPGRLERAGGRDLARDLRPARRARALPRARRLGAHGDPARRRRARPARRGAGVLAAAQPARVPGPRAARAGRALRRPGGRDRLRRRVPQRRGLHAADGRVPAPGEAAPAGLAGRRRARASPATLVALGRRARAQPRHAVVRLRDLGARDVLVEVDVVQLGPLLRRAQLAARRPRAAARASAPARVLEGREPRRVRRARLAARAGQLRRRRSSPTTRARCAPGRSASRSRSATCARTSSSPRATPPSSRSRGCSVIQTRDGLYVPPRTLRRGDAYTARVYTPRPTERQRRAAGADYDFDLAEYTTISTAVLGVPGADHLRMTFPFFGTDPTEITYGPPRNGPPDTVLRESGLFRTYELARRLAEGARTPEEYVQRVLEHLGGKQYTYSEVPPKESSHARRLPVRRQAGLLPAVLGRDGAAAADGRRPGAGGHRLLDRRDRHQDRRVHRARLRRALLGRGLLPRLGLAHVRPDAGRLAGAQPARRLRERARLEHRRRPRPSAATRWPSAARASPSRPSRRPWWRIPAIVAGALALLGLLALAVRRWRRGAPPALSELERALRRTRREPAPGTTLHALEARFAQTPAAAGYVRALRESRYRDAPGHPTRAQRRGLRSELGRGGGILGRLRAWWALPPR